jgi:hypothetical protein
LDRKLYTTCCALFIIGWCVHESQATIQEIQGSYIERQVAETVSGKTDLQVGEMITDNLKWKKDSVLAKKLNEALKEDPTHKPIMGGLITDPLPAKVRKLEERVKVLEDLLWSQIENQNGNNES